MKRQRLFKCCVVRFKCVEDAQARAEDGDRCMRRIGVYPRCWTRRLLLVCRYMVEEVWLIECGMHYQWVVPYKCDCANKNTGLPARAYPTVFCPQF